jgi:predicted ribosome quality control (RQC) complex YloA/Tae2 family protein
MEDQTRYVAILRGSLERKENILNNLLEMTRQQEDYLKSTDFEMDIFNDMMDVKAQMIEELNTVDDGFEVTYERIGAYLKEHQGKFADTIREMQNRVREITRLSNALKAMEERNRQKLEQIFAKRQREVRGFRQGAKVVSNYYQSMSGAGIVNTSVVDQKK